jgi:hypothetical protein
VFLGLRNVILMIFGGLVTFMGGFPGLYYSWLNLLFTDAQDIFWRQVAYYDSLNFLEYILNKISYDKNNKCKSYWL